MIHKWIGTDLEGNCTGLIKGSGGNEENHKNKPLRVVSAPSEIRVGHFPSNNDNTERAAYL
jgi:hypothetical protein